MNAAITADEVEEVLKLLPSANRLLIAPLFNLVFNAFLDGGSIPQSMLHSYISLIPKPDKDPLDCSNYRPIALLNADLNIFTKILANCLSLWLTQLIHKDQVGLVPCRQGGDNTRKAIDLIEVVNGGQRLFSCLVLTWRKPLTALLVIYVSGMTVFRICRSFFTGPT